MEDVNALDGGPDNFIATRIRIIRSTPSAAPHVASTSCGCIVPTAAEESAFSLGVAGKKEAGVVGHGYDFYSPVHLCYGAPLS